MSGTSAVIVAGNLGADLLELLERFEGEMAYNDAKGAAPYRQGMHDGLFFGRDQLALVLKKHGIERGDPRPMTAEQAAVTPPRQYGL